MALRPDAILRSADLWIDKARKVEVPPGMNLFEALGDALPIRAVVFKELVNRIEGKEVAA